MKKKFWTSEKLLGLSALLVSLFTLVVFIYQTNLIRKQQYMAVYPYLELGNYSPESLEYKYTLTNKGVGPALIKSVEVRDRMGKSYNSIHEYLCNKLHTSDSVWTYRADIYEGRLISAEEEIILFGLFDEEQARSRGIPKNTTKGAIKLHHTLNSNDLVIKITYESIYGESWTISKNSKIPVKN